MVHGDPSGFFCAQSTCEPEHRAQGTYGILTRVTVVHTKAAHATLTEWQRRAADDRLELVAGELVPKAQPDFIHAQAQFGLAEELRPVFHRRGGGANPGGWWIAGEVDLVLGEDGFRPDLVGWRRERVPTMPQERPVAVRPDWVCEVLSQSNASHDTIVKMWRYHAAHIPHYWILDPVTQTLAVYRDSADGYVNVLMADAGQTVRAEPFAALELRVGLLFGVDRDDPAPR